jgi:hypothetical protein
MVGLVQAGHVAELALASNRVAVAFGGTSAMRSRGIIGVIGNTGDTDSQH